MEYSLLRLHVHMTMKGYYIHVMQLHTSNTVYYQLDNNPSTTLEYTVYYTQAAMRTRSQRGALTALF